jgi:hypothetical protein
MNAKLNAISSSLAAEQAAVHAQIDAERAAVRAQINAEHSTFRAQIDDLQYAENVQRRHDRLIAVIVLLMLIAAGTVAYRRLANRKI